MKMHRAFLPRAIVEFAETITGTGPLLVTIVAPLVTIGKTGEVGLHPNQITADESAAAIQLAKRFDEGLWAAR